VLSVSVPVSDQGATAPAGQGTSRRHLDLCPTTGLRGDLRDPRSGQGGWHRRRAPVHRSVHGAGRRHPQGPWGTSTRNPARSRYRR